MQRKHLNTQFEFLFKSFNCAMNLIPNDAGVKLTFYTTYLLIEMLDKKETENKTKWFSMRINAKVDQNK